MKVWNCRLAYKLRNYDNRIDLNETKQHLATESVNKGEKALN